MKRSLRQGARVAGVLVAALAGLGACRESPAPGPTGPAMPVASRPAAAPAVIARGGELFRKHCAACHGERAQGAPAWERPGADGKYPAPPLNGTAHAWHHPKAQLRDVIRNGTQRIGGNMPPWRDKLNDADIDTIIAWFQSLWPDDLYAAWADIDRRARERGR